MNHDTTNSSVYTAETKYCHSCGGFISGIYAGNPAFCRCNQNEKLERELAEKTNEIARLRVEVQRVIEDRNRIGIEIRGEYLPKLKEQANEVARLREENVKLRGIAEKAMILCEAINTVMLSTSLEKIFRRKAEIINQLRLELNQATK